MQHMADINNSGICDICFYGITRQEYLINSKEKSITIIKEISEDNREEVNKFIQKRGFELVKVYKNAVESARAIKPEIPLYGDFNIPIKHELEFELIL